MDRHIGDVIAAAREGTAPAAWKIHVMPRRPISVWLIVWYLFAWYLGAAAFVWIAGLAGFGDVAAVVAVAVGVGVTIWRVGADVALRGLVIITEDEVVEYAPMQVLARRRWLSFATVRGMVVQRVDAEGETALVITSYCVAYRTSSGRQKVWTLNERYGYPKTRGETARRVCADIVAQFERRNTNDATGLASSRTVRDLRFID